MSSPPPLARESHLRDVPCSYSLYTPYITLILTSHSFILTSHSLHHTHCHFTLLLDGDIEEMVDELSGGKMMYAFLRVKDPNTQLFKNVLVNWVSFSPSDGCIERRRGVSE